MVHSGKGMRKRVRELFRKGKKADANQSPKLPTATKPNANTPVAPPPTIGTPKQSPKLSTAIKPNTNAPVAPLPTLGTPSQSPEVLTPTNLPLAAAKVDYGDLWDTAYESLREEKLSLVEGYEKLLNCYREEGEPGSL
jgi:hypothetical protein